MSSLHSGERQVSETVDGIRRDHVARYEWAAKLLKGLAVADLACGVGYGTWTLAQTCKSVIGFDIDHESLDYARWHYVHERARYKQIDANTMPRIGAFDAVTCFETVEHVRNPRPMLSVFRASAQQLLASVPNEAVFPYTGQKFHFRHYTKDQFAELLAECGWRVVQWWTQDTPTSEVRAGDDGWTIIAQCEHGPLPDPVADVMVSL
jgi:hypothetical protein